MQEHKLVRQNLLTCLKKTALAWYTSKLIPNQKQLLKMSHGIDKWERKLVKRFSNLKELLNVAMGTIVR